MVGTSKFRETEQRILAVLYLNDGEILSKNGRAPSRLSALMAVRPSRQTLSENLRMLEARQLIIRDIQKVSKHPGMAGITVARCYGILLAVDRNDLIPEYLDQSYVDELKNEIAYRMMGKIKGAEKQVKQETVKTKVAKLEAGRDEPSERIADALLAKVIEMAQNPPVTKVDDSEQVKKLKEQIAVLERNIDQLIKRVNEAADENSKLRSAVRNGRSQRSGHLTQKIGELLSEDDRQALSRMMTERPNSERGSSPKPVA
jgi:hypothetical protein